MIMYGPLMAVYAMHGIFSEGNAKAFQNRCLIQEDKFDNFLSSLPFKFVSLDDAVAGQGHALTIDDATNAAFRAALLARKNGHAVSVFVNPDFIQSQRPYFFLELNAILDRTSFSSICFEDFIFPVDLRSQRRMFRIQVKDKFCMLDSIEKIESLINDIAMRLGVARDGLPQHLRTMTKAELLMLVEAGVNIENHGFSHLHPKALRWSALRREIALTQDWIQQICGQESHYFAVPFGDCLPQWRLPKEDKLIWLTLHDQIQQEVLGPRIWNRLPVENLLEDTCKQ